MIKIRPYKDDDLFVWDNFCKSSFQSTFLHTRLFLKYHGDRFEDNSLIIEDDKKVIGLMPAARDLNDPNLIVTHPGATFGGVLHQGDLRAVKMIKVFESIKSYYSQLGFSRLLYKVVPIFYHKVPAQDDLYALFRLGAKLKRCDISSTIDLSSRNSLSQRRKRSLKKAEKFKLIVKTDISCLPDFWVILSDNLSIRHGVKPIHSLSEISYLTANFPQEIKFIGVYLEDQIVAGTLLFCSTSVFHAQYIAASALGYQVSALDMVFDYAIKLAYENGCRWFDFGISTENNGSILNEGLFNFKSEFGAGEMIHEFYELKIGE